MTQLTLFSPQDYHDDRPLPLLVAERWGFPLQYHNVDEVLYYSVQDWLRGLTGEEDVRKLWTKIQADALLNNQMSISSRHLPYIATDGKTYQRDFATDETLYQIAGNLRSTAKRPALKAIKDFLAKSGVLVDTLRRDPETALAVAQTALSAQESRYLDSGKDNKWIESRLTGVLSRKAFTQAIKDAVGEGAGALYGQATNTVYRGLFDRTANELRSDLGLAPHQNPRDHFSQIALHYVGLAEAICTAKLADISQDDHVPPQTALAVIKAVAELLGMTIDQITQLLGADVVTGRLLLD